MPHCRPSTASKVSLDRVETHSCPSPLPAVDLGVSASALIARHVGLLHDAEEGAPRVLKHNEVVSSTIPPGISARSPQSDQSLNFGLLVRGVEVEMKPTPAAWTPIATLEREIGTFVLWVTENHPAVFRRLARHVMKRRLPKGNRAVEVVAMNDEKSSTG
jgi:hypothetical protein